MLYFNVEHSVTNSLLSEFYYFHKKTILMKIQRLQPQLEFII